MPLKVLAVLAFIAVSAVADSANPGQAAARGAIYLTAALGLFQSVILFGLHTWRQRADRREDARDLLLEEKDAEIKRLSDRVEQVMGLLERRIASDGPPDGRERRRR